MSKSLKRVDRALQDAGLSSDIREVGQARTAREAADSIGCAIDQIAKSIVFGVAGSDEVVLFLTAGGNQVDAAKASALVGADLVRADASLVRASTGFAIGGVAPIGHLTPPRAWWDPRLSEFDTIWAAAGTPRHVFPAKPDALCLAARATVAAFIQNQ